MNIEKLTIKNNYFRKVLYTGPYEQVVLMSLKPLEEIGLEKHKFLDQFIKIEYGSGIAIINSKKYKIGAGSFVLIPANNMHNIINTSKSKKLKLYTVYSHKQHSKNCIQKKKSDHEC